MTIHEFLQGDKFALLAGVELLETGNGYAKARMLIKPEHLNGGGVCQGGAIFTLADRHGRHGTADGGGSE